MTDLTSQRSALQYLNNKMKEIPRNITTRDYLQALEKLTQGFIDRKSILYREDHRLELQEIIERLRERLIILRRINGKLEFKKIDSENYDILLGDSRVGVLEKDRDNRLWSLWLGKGLYMERHHMDMLSEDTSRRRMETTIRRNLQNYLEYLTRRYCWPY